MVQTNQAGKRVGIALPNPLYEKLRTIELDRSVSIICQEALERAIEIAEAKQRVAGGRESLISRLRAERRRFSSEDFQTGRAHGLNAAQELEYRDFRQLNKLWGQRDEIILRDGGWLRFQTLSFYWDDEMKANQLQEEIRALEENEEVALPDRYLAGWLEGIIEVWNDIAEDVEH
ncbi:MAG: hypothetical protein AAFY11_09865 [Cyanobacteria bacterium J06641_5]